MGGSPQQLLAVRVRHALVEDAGVRWVRTRQEVERLVAGGGAADCVPASAQERVRPVPSLLSTGSSQPPPRSISPLTGPAGASVNRRPVGLRARREPGYDGLPNRWLKEVCVEESFAADVAALAAWATESGAAEGGPVRWCLGRMPNAYRELARTYESRYAEEITRLQRGALVGWVREAPVGSVAGLRERLERLNERFGLPPLPPAPMPRKRRAL
jgi:hypothetical protein